MDSVGVTRCGALEADIGKHLQVPPESHELIQKEYFRLRTRVSMCTAWCIYRRNRAGHDHASLYILNGVSDRPELIQQEHF